ncbi:hypothetical protein IMCC1989_1994 [gamma proteobacterium IMCC1989]|nr:hypothetical protein IMCC1989_1994 [gamma proteobacterium IMCC1989]
MDAISISAISMQNDLQKLDQLSHNVANMSTPAYKRTLSATESFTNTVSRFESPNRVASTIQNAIPTISTSRDFTTGSLSSTSNPLDLAIEGDGFFELTNNTGTFYSKRGNFLIDNNGQVKLSGTELLLNGVSGDIRLQDAEPEINSLGQIFENGKEVSQIRVINFDNPSSLISLGQGIFKVSEASVQKEVELPSIRQSFLEASNSQPAEDMLNLIQLARHIEATQQVIRGYDGMLATVFEDLGKF